MFEAKAKLQLYLCYSEQQKILVQKYVVGLFFLITQLYKVILGANMYGGLAYLEVDKRISGMVVNSTFW